MTADEFGPTTGAMEATVNGRPYPSADLSELHWSPAEMTAYAAESTFVRAGDVHATLREALLAMRDDLPSAVGLHSGPSKSADIGHIMVKGVHGPGRLVAVVIGA